MQSSGSEAIRPTVGGTVRWGFESTCFVLGANVLLKALHITTVGGSLHFLKGLPAFLRVRGIDLSALSAPGAGLERFRETEKVPAYSALMERRISPLADLRAVVAILRVIRSVQPSIVHAHTPKGGLLGMIASSIARVPIRIYHLRGLPLMGASGPKRVLLTWTERASCLMASRVICVSDSLREYVIAEGICSAGKIKVLANGSGQGVDGRAQFNPCSLPPGTRDLVRDDLNIPRDAVVIGFVGRIVRDKGVIELSAAWEDLRVRHPKVYLMIVGRSESMDAVPVDVMKLLLQDDRVRFVGHVEQTRDYYSAMDILVHPSHREGFPNVVLEAGAMELPVVTTAVIGCRDAVVHGVTGTLVPVNDAAALAAGLDAYVLSPVLRRTVGEAARQRVLRDFSREGVWSALYAEYEMLLRDHGLCMPLEYNTHGETDAAF